MVSFLPEKYLWGPAPLSEVHVSGCDGHVQQANPIETSLQGKNFSHKELKTKQRLDEKPIEVNGKTPAGFTGGWTGSQLQTSETNAKFV